MADKQQKNKFPVGIIIILVLMGWGILSILMTVFTDFSLYQVGPFVLTADKAKIATLAILLIIGSGFYGIFNRLKWARKLMIAWYLFSIVLSIVNLLSFIRDPEMFTEHYVEMFSPQEYAVMTSEVMLGTMISGSVFAVMISVIIIVYLSKKKDFFVNE